MKRIAIVALAPLFFACSSGNNEADAYGNFEADEIIISSEVPGLIVQIAVDEGDLSQKGKLVAQLDSTQLSLKKDQLESSIEALKSKLQNVPVQLKALEEKQAAMERESARVGKLLQKKAATQKQLDDIQSELEITKKQMDALESQLSIANRAVLAQIKPLRVQVEQVVDQLEKTSVKAPSRGTILQKYKMQGEVTGVGQPIVKIADLDRLTLRAYVSGDQLEQIKIGNEVRVSIDSEDEDITYPGKVKWISPRAEFTPKSIQTKEERVSLVYAVKIEVENDGRIKIGMPAEVRF